MKILVFDSGGSISGHRIPYAALVAKSFSNCEVIVALPSQLQGEPILSSYFPNHVELKFFTAHEQTKTLAIVREAWRCLKECIATHQPDLVAVPTADGLAFWGGLTNLFGMSGTRNTLIDISLMRGHFCSASISKSKKLISRLKWWVVTKGPWRRILLIDPRSFEDLSDPVAQRVELCPDPAPVQTFFDRNEARKALGLPLDAQVIVSVGGQEPRKGTDLLLRAFQKAEFDNRVFLVLMGKFSSATKQLAEQILTDPHVQNRLIIRDAYATDDDLEQAVVASNLVAVPYRDVERPSGIVSRAIAWNRPIIATDRGWLKWFVERYQAGHLTQPENTAQFAKDLKTALFAGENFRISATADKFRTFNTELCYLHTWNSEFVPEIAAEPDK